jgi:ankyrin repeat protein
MWEVDPQDTKQFIEAFWSGHILDWSNLDMDRHCYNLTQPLNKPWVYEYKDGPVFFGGKGFDPLTTGVDLVYAAAWLNILSGEDEPLVWGKRLASRYIEARNPKTGISPGTFSTNIKLNRFWSVFPHPNACNKEFLRIKQGGITVSPEMFAGGYTGLWLCEYLLGRLLEDEGRQFMRWSHEELVAMGKTSYRERDNSFVPISRDGISLEGYVVKEDGYLGFKGNVLSPVPLGPGDFWAYVFIYSATGDKFMWNMARSIAIGNGYGDIGVSPVDKPKLTTDIVISSQYALLGFLELYKRTGKNEFLCMAKKIGGNILSSRLNKGFFVASSKHIYTKFDTVYPLVLLHLYSMIKGEFTCVPQVWPGHSYFENPYRWKEEGEDNRIIYTLIDSIEPPISLQESAAKGDLGQVKFLISQGADINVREDSLFKTALHRAVMEGHKEIADFLLSQGAQTDARDSFLATPLYYAVKNGYKNIVGLLIAHGSDINTKDIYGQTPLDIAISRGYKDIAEILIDKEANINSADNKGETPMYIAVKNGQRDIAEILIDKGADINAKDEDGQTPLDIAVRDGRNDIIELLLANGAEASSIFVAAAIGDLSKVKEFLEEGVDINAKEGPRGQTALHLAASEGHMQVVEFLVENGAHVNAGMNLNRTAAEMAMDNNHNDIVKLLISKGADVSPLHLAIAMKDETKARTLIELSVNVNQKTQYGTTPLHKAVKAGMKNIVQLLIKKGADVNAKDNWKCTPLNFAIDGGKIDIVRLLIDAGADVNTKSGSDRTPLQYAKQRDLTGIVELLRKHGAKE